MTRRVGNLEKAEIGFKDPHLNRKNDVAVK
jgi:hypothetical protein